jgi:hypothetical protein
LKAESFPGPGGGGGDYLKYDPQQSERGLSKIRPWPINSVT